MGNNQGKRKSKLAYAPKPKISPPPKKDSHAKDAICHQCGDMTATVVNNSVFRAFFEKQRLTGPNFIDWYRNLRIVLLVEDRLPSLEQPIPAMPVPPAGQVLPPDVLATHSAWVKASKEIAGLMLMTMDPDIQKNLEQLGAYDMLKELKTLYAQQAEQELLQTVREFHACK
ncbi:hypothetical protein Tco_0412382 [Tanacetum coccineum]